MPRRDATGPMGAGPHTGRGLGACAKNRVVKYGAGVGAGLGLGLGLFCRRGYRRGFGRGPAATDIASESQKELLLQQKIMLQERLDAVERQLSGV